MSNINEVVEKLGGVVDFEDSRTVKCLFPERLRKDVSTMDLKAMDRRDVLVIFQPKRGESGTSRGRT